MKIFLRAKHWQLFSVIFVIPFIFYIYIMIEMFSQIEQIAYSSATPDPFFIFDTMRNFYLVAIPFMVINFLWFWSLGVGLYNKLPSGVPMKIGFFKFVIIYTIVFFSGMMYAGYHFMGLFTSPDFPDVIGENIFGMLKIMVIISPFYLFSIFCMFYSFVHIAKTIKAVELQRAVKFDDYIGEFFLMWFSFIGVWIIQPKVNKMVDEESTIKE